MEIELKKAIARMKKGECIVVPVMCQESTLVESLPFYSLNRIPRDGKPISSFRPHSKGCVQATDALKIMIEKTFPKCKTKSKPISSSESKPTRQKDLKKATDNSKGEISIPLVKNGRLQNIAINQKFVELIPDYLTNLLDFNTMMNQSLDNSVKRFSKQYKSKLWNKNTLLSMEMDELRLFLMDICGYIKKYITDSVGIRVHFRCTKDKYYLGVLASTEKEDSVDMDTDWSTDLTPIPVTQGLIYYSTQLKAPLLKSLNPKLNYKGNNDSIWKEYLTYSFRNLDNGKKSVLSMAISVHKDYLLDRKELFMLLSYTSFGELIERYIMKYCERCSHYDKAYNIEKIVTKI
jgi:hypothetical protein